MTVPVPQVHERKTFGPERFSLTVLEDGVRELTCPNGETTRQRDRVEKDTGDKYVFSSVKCRGCPLRAQCLQNPASSKGRTVIKNDYEAEYARARAKVGTPAYEQTRREHPRIERKLGELARHHDLRHARYRGRERTMTQALLTGLVVNIKRMVRLLTQKIVAAASGIAVRAEVATA